MGEDLDPGNGELCPMIARLTPQVDARQQQPTESETEGEVTDQFILVSID